MSNIRTEIQNALTLTPLNAERQATAELCLAEDFTGFQGHFPGRPVLPAVCMISAVLAAVQEAVGAKVTLEAVKSAKFFAPVLPKEPVRIEFKLNSISAPTEVRANLTNNDRKTAQIYLAFHKS